jgi:hypothetical protein
VGKRNRARRAGPGAEALLPRPLGPDAPASPVERLWRVLLAVARNAVGVVGVLFLGWAAPTLVVLYFADTLAGMWAVFAAVGFKLSNADPRQGVGAVLEGALTATAVGLFLVAVVAVPLGIPVVMLLGASSVTWRQLSADPTLATGVGVVALTGLVGAVRHVFALAEGRAGDASVKQVFAILMTRWVLVLIAIYNLGFILGRFGLYAIVLAYAAASVWSELEPERFARLIPDRRPDAARN